MTQQDKDPGFFKSFILFLKHKKFRKHLLISFVAGFGLLWLAFALLSSYTHHGETVTVPDLDGVSLDDVGPTLAELGLRYQVIDSVFEAKKKPGVVVRQDPEKNTQVKENRTIYLTASSTLPPLVKMPNLVDASMRQAIALLESSGLEVGKWSYLPDPCLNCVLAQTHKGKKIAAGTMVPKGSVINLVLGKGEGDEKINIPCLMGMPFPEAAARITENGLSQGTVMCKDCKSKKDSLAAKVVRQDPPCSSENLIVPGTIMNLYISVKGIPEKEKAATPKEDAENFDEE